MRKLLYLLWLLMGILPAKAQSPSPAYLMEPSKFNSELLQNTILGIANDENGMLWTVTQYGCYRYDGFNTQTYLMGNKHFLQSDRYRYLIKDSIGNRLIAVGDMDYYFIQNSKLHKKENNDSILISNYYNFLLVPRKRLEKNDYFKKKSIINASLLFTKSDTFFIIGENYFNYTKNKFVTDIGFKNTDQTNLLYRNGQQYELNNNGLYCLSLENGVFIRKLSLALNGFHHVITNIDNNSIWIENEHEIRKISLPSLKITVSFSKNMGEIFSQSILEDTETGIIYLGTVKKGVYVIQANNFKKLIAENYTNSYCYNKVLQSYCITSAKGIGYFNNSRLYQEKFLHPKDLLNLYIYSDAQQRIWFQNSKSAILLLNPFNNKLVDSIPFSDFMAIVKQLDNHHFIIGNHQTIFIYDTRTKNRDTIFISSPEIAINDACFYNNQYFVATNNGLYVLDSKYNKIKHYLEGIALRKSILIKHHLLALGSYGKGFFLLKNNKLYSASTEKFPQLSAVNSLSLDDDGALWVICNKAAFVWNVPDVQNNSIPPPDHIFQVEKDLPCSELNGGLNPDVFPNHEIVLPSSDGLLIFKKQDLIRKPSNSPISISYVILGDSVLKRVSEFSIPAGSPELKFLIDAANLEYHAKTETEYRIRELDTSWHILPENRTLEFSRLPKGIYHLEFRKNRKDAPFLLSNFTVLPYWYQTAWAYLLFLLAGNALVYFIVKLRIRSQQLYQKKLESIIDEKTKTLQNNINKLHASEKELKRQHRYRNKLYSILMHDLKSPLTFLSNYSIQQLGSKKTVEKESMRVIAKSSSELSSFINEFLFWLGNQTNPDNVVFNEINLSELLFEQAEFYRNFASINNNKIFYFEREKNIFFHTDTDRLKIILRNLLDNANKYTNNGIIKISHQIDSENNTLIFIEDSGKGLPENITRLINTVSTTETISASINANHKMGLMISKELITQISGNITVISNENTGTRFTISLASKNHTD